ncbi:hypothetical protein H0X10_03180 [Candidatus Saccharibacteria bacterium]|nr:hypothetical protein [Candidatus Saccharibacteria bacterium]
MPATTTLYKKAVEVSEEYLGPAGERFIRRQISTHIGIEPEELGGRDLPKLVNWASLAFALLTDNSHEVKGFTRDMLSISSSRK